MHYSGGCQESPRWQRERETNCIFSSWRLCCVTRSYLDEALRLVIQMNPGVREPGAVCLSPGSARSPLLGLRWLVSLPPSANEGTRTGIYLIPTTDTFWNRPSFICTTPVKQIRAPLPPRGKRGVKRVREITDGHAPVSSGAAIRTQASGHGSL